MVVKTEEMRGVFAKAQLQTKWENGKILRNKQWTCLNSLEKKKTVLQKDKYMNMQLARQMHRILLC